MLNIAVCDDNPIFLDQFRSLVPTLRQIEEARFFQFPGQLLEEIAGGRFRPDLVLMDIQFDGDKTGLHWAEELFRLAPEVGVICVTGYNDRYAQQILLHDINLIGYLTKPLDRAVLCRYLDKALSKKQGRSYLTFVLRGQTYSISANSIVYIESRNHTAIVHAREENFEFYEKLSDLLPRLPDCFVQCHKSYLVNLDRISRLEPGHLLLDGGRVVPVSKAFQPQLKDSFFRHIGQAL